MTDPSLYEDVERVLLDTGAALVACADLEPLPADVRRNLPRGVSIAAALDPSVVAEIADGPTRQYAAEYNRLNGLLSRLAEQCVGLLGERGFTAVAGEPTVDKLDMDTLATPLPHKTVATRAGLGWIGKCALLINKRYGPAVRYNSVLTDAPLPAGKPAEASRCGDCQECIEACPVGAPSGRHWQLGLQREEFFDAFSCCECARRQSPEIGIDHTICGICIAACPFTKQYLVGSKGTGD